MASQKRYCRCCHCAAEMISLYIPFALRRADSRSLLRVGLVALMPMACWNRERYASLVCDSPAEPEMSGVRSLVLSIVVGNAEEQSTRGAEIDEMKCSCTLRCKAGVAGNQHALPLNGGKARYYIRRVPFAIPPRLSAKRLVGHRKTLRTSITFSNFI